MKPTAGCLTFDGGRPSIRSASAISSVTRASARPWLRSARNTSSAPWPSPLRSSASPRSACAALERDAHLREHLVVTLEREQRLPEDNATLDRGRTTEQSQPTHLDGLLVLPG